MDMNQYTATAGKDSCLKLRQHLLAIRKAKLEVAEIIMLLNENPPNAEGAREVLSELPQQTQIDLWSVSTKAGGMWMTWERDALKYGHLTESYRVYCEQTGRPFYENN